jgi:DNA-binding response OmpR family regulator
MTFRVVHVEQATLLRSSLAAALEAAEPDIALQHFGNGEEALIAIQQHPDNIDLIILNVWLPGAMSGIQVAHNLRRLGYTGNIVFISGSLIPPVEDLNALDAEYLAKPGHLLELPQRLAHYRSVKRSAARHQSLVSDTASPAPVRNATATQAMKPAVIDTHKSCPACGRQWPLARAVCANCGAVLTPSVSATHRMLAQQAPARVKQERMGSVFFKQEQPIFLVMGEVTVALPQASIIVVGRLAEVPEEGQAALDLTSFGAVEHGVSRRHLQITRRQECLYVVDLGSMNGTWLNGRPLSPRRDCLLRHGDQLRLGSLEITIEFQQVITAPSNQTHILQYRAAHH